MHAPLYRSFYGRALTASRKGAMLGDPENQGTFPHLTGTQRCKTVNSIPCAFGFRQLMLMLT